MTLPIDRTNLTAAQTNQVPSQVLQSAKNIAAIKTAYDTIDELNSKVNTNYQAGAIGTTQLADGSVSTVKLADSSVSTAKIADNAVTASKIPNGSIAQEKIANQAIGTAQLADASFTASKLADGSVTASKLDPAIMNDNVPLNQHRLTSVLDHPDGSVTLAKLGLDVQSQINEIANLKAISTLSNRVDGSSRLFYELNDGLNGGSAGRIDLTTTNVPATTSIGATTVTVTSVTGFTVGQEVTLFDDVNLERPVISAINTGTKVVTFVSALTKAYKASAQLCRSSVVQDTTNKLLKFNGWSHIAIYAITSPTTVVASAYDTSGNNGDKLVHTANGNVITIELNGTTIQVQKSIDKGLSFQPLCTITGAQVGAAITRVGANNVTVLWNSTTVVYSNTFDVTTVTNTDQNANKVIVDSAMTSITNNVSIETGSDGIPQATWSGIHPTYPNSKNPRYSKATTTSVTAWATPTQIATNNTAGTDVTNPSIVVKSNNNPVIVAQTTPTTAYAILAWVFSGSAWTASAGVSIYAGAANSQQAPCAVISPDGVIHVSWHGIDATESAAWNDRYSKSADGGATWSAMLKLTSGNTYNQMYSSITADKNNNVYIMWQGQDPAVNATYYNIRRIIWNGTSWGAITTLTSNTTASAQDAQTLTNYTDFTDPLVIYKDLQATAVKFRGTWQSLPVLTPVLVEDVRYNITPPSNVSSIVAWVDHDADPNYSVAGAASFQASGGNESYTALTKTTAAIDGTHNEDQFVGSGTANAKATLRLTLTRNSTSLVKNISSVTGAVGS